MKKEELDFREDRIKSLFDGESRKFKLPKEELALSTSAEFHVKMVSDVDSQSVIDVGSGKGRLLLGMLNNGVDIGLGVDLSPKSTEIAKMRLARAGISEDRYKLITGSFLDLDPLNLAEIGVQYDAVSMQFVLCCHPDREGLLKKSVYFKPKVVVLSVPGHGSYCGLQ